MSYKNVLVQIDELKQGIDACRPLSRHAAQELRNYYRIGLTYASNALEGNSLTETETKIVLEEGITIGGKLLKDHLEAVGHAQAYDRLYKLAKKDAISERNILLFHKLFYQAIDAKNAGKYRKVPIFITGTDFVPPAPREIPALMEKLVQEFVVLRVKEHPVVFAALAHLKFVTVHPFVDGNGRTARLLMNLALLQAGYAITIIPPMLRHEYLSALRAVQATHDEQVFVRFIVETVYEAQKEYIRLLKKLV